MQIFITETGMGCESMERAVSWLLSRNPWPDLLVSMGFAGSLSPGVKIGEVLLVDRVFHMMADEAQGYRLQPMYGAQYPDALRRFAVAAALRSAGLLTVMKPEPKPLLAHLVCRAGSCMCPSNEDRHEPPGGYFLVDMETFHIAEAAAQAHIPLLCLRGVSDGLDDEILFDISEIMNDDGRVSTVKAVTLLMKRPTLLPFFIQSWRRAGMAADALARVMVSLLDLPLSSLVQSQWQAH